MTSLNMKELTTFLYKASLPHATGTSNARTMPDVSTTITSEQGSWTFHDNFFGGEPYGGRAVIHYNEKPVWFMAYYGRVHDTPRDPDTIYDFLRLALRQAPEARPLRGPDDFKKGDLVYHNTLTGDIENFSGKEAINDGNKGIYWAIYMGGLVDQRSGVGF